MYELAFASLVTTRTFRSLTCAPLFPLAPVAVRRTITLRRPSAAAGSGMLRCTVGIVTESPVLGAVPAVAHVAPPSIEYSTSTVLSAPLLKRPCRNSTYAALASNVLNHRLWIPGWPAAL